jgi:CRISPR/Cas system endoribonuclease Cas6 (RAMP superfamily)
LAHETRQMISLRFNLVHVGGVAPAGFLGLQTRAAFLRWVKEADPSLSALLHGAYDAARRRRSVYSLRPLSYLGSSSGGYSESRQLEPSKTAKAWFEVNFRSGQVGTTALAALLKTERRDLELLGAKFQLDSIGVREVDPEGEAKKIEKYASASGALDLRFKTPTFFSTSSGRFKVIVPNLLLMFMNAANDMHILNYRSVPRKIVLDLRRSLGMTGIDIRSQLVRAEGKLYPGFTGWTRLGWRELDDESMRTLCLLLAWSTIFNTGGGRSAGFGVVAVYPGFRRERIRSLGGGDEGRVTSQSGL